MKRTLQSVAIVLAMMATLSVAVAACILPGLYAASTEAGEVCSSFATLAARSDYARAAELSVHDAKHAERVAHQLHESGEHLHITGSAEHNARERDFRVIEGTLEHEMGWGNGQPFACFAEKRGSAWRVAAWVVGGEIL